MKYKEAGKKRVQSSLYSTLPETLETQHAKEASQLQSQVHARKRRHRLNGPKQPTSVQLSLARTFVRTDSHVRVFQFPAMCKSGKAPLQSEDGDNAPEAVWWLPETPEDEIPVSSLVHNNNSLDNNGLGNCSSANTNTQYILYTWRFGLSGNYSIRTRLVKCKFDYF